ncbi:IDEAL domain-containing protein [Bacillus piscicola]|uniref:IDEAL domain-containing protein n=1 Tax=Bacillus piscicola TaxID=1632684 RepID=UPI001F09E22F|nr:IDEAL domain-containing protein [Bacillus piscicola]
MHSYFTVVHPSPTDIHYVKNEQERVFSLKRGDQLQITDQGFYIEGKGWFISTIINGAVRVFVSFHDIENCLERRIMMNAADMEMKRSVWNEQIDQALEEKNKEWFRFIARKLASLKSC